MMAQLVLNRYACNPVNLLAIHAAGLFE